MSSAQIRLVETEAGWRELAVEISSILKLHETPPKRWWPLVLAAILFVGTAVTVALWPVRPVPVDLLPAAIVPAPPRITPPRPPEKMQLHKRVKKIKKR